jgi:serine/threonine protein kinase
MSELKLSFIEDVHLWQFQTPFSANFLAEIAFMKSVGYHEHIVNMLGCITDKRMPCLVVELCAHGDLLHLLRDSDPKAIKV